MCNSSILFHNDSNVTVLPKMQRPNMENENIKYGIFKLQTIDKPPIIHINIKNGVLYDEYTKDWHNDFVLYHSCIDEEKIFYIACIEENLYEVEIELTCLYEDDSYELVNENNNVNLTIYSYPPLIDMNTNMLDITDISSYYENPIQIE
jgi:hypothetical protein